MKPRLRFEEDEIPEVAARYKYALTDDELVALRPVVTQRGYLDKRELRTIVRWKAPRVIRRVEPNTDEYVREVTRFALHTKDERARIESLLMLDGVLWPTASVILHFLHPEPYPILDFRALWSASLDVPSQYRFAFWWEYVCFCRSLAERNSVDMRTLDKAMWQYSKENQNRA